MQGVADARASREAANGFSIAWFDGELREMADIGVHPFAHALHYGSGVFEGIRAYATPRGTAVFRLRDHLDRLYASAAVYDLPIPFDREELAAAVFATMRANGFGSGYIRPLVFFGEGGIALAPRYACSSHVLIALKPLSGSLVGDTAAARVTISPFEKVSSRALPATAKACGHYTNSILALHDAKARGYDEALLLNDRGDVAEGTGENVFFVKDGRLRTNDTTADALGGITQATVVELAHELRIPVTIGRISVCDLRAADEVFMTGTAAEVMPIAQIDDLRLPAVRPITDILSAAYKDAVVGNNTHHLEWVQHS